MKECDILGEGVKTYSDPSYIFSGGQEPPNLPGSTPLVMKECDILGEGSKHTLTPLTYFQGVKSPQTSQDLRPW